MINGVNTVDFNFAKDNKTTKKISTALPQARSELITVFQYAYAKPELTITAKNLTTTNEMEPPSGLERVHVQRLQTHTQLRNNKWTYQNFYSNSTGAVAAATTNANMDTIVDAAYKTQYNQNHNNNKTNNNNNNNNNIINNNKNNLNKNLIENKSALIKCNNSNEEQLRQQKHQQQQQQQSNTGITVTSQHMKNIRVAEPKQNFSDTFMINGVALTDDNGDKGNARTNFYRTKDQENAFRRIEDVHNYAKLKQYGGHSNECSDGSTRDFDDDDVEDYDDEDEEEDDDDGLDDENVNDDVGVSNDLAPNDCHVQMPYKKVGNGAGNGKTHVISVGAGYLQSTSHVDKNYVRTPSKSSSTEDTDAIVDVETVPCDEVREQQLMQSPPAHHARRPMNAFLIFCKRHRAIVKDRYKSLENRAITKILGDWWASLDGDEKECFTKLAQQNKDAFFSAHPNFKWYKLPAPPLRTLSTRPSNAERHLEDNDHDQQQQQQTDEPAKIFAKTQSGGFFKLADVTQMGELNSLMNERNKIDCALQKALGETTHFLSAHMPCSNVETSAAEINEGQIDVEKRNIKRRAIIENGFSSNSSEDDLLPKKSSRSCKGKIYQELVSSGQIAPIAKKTKLTKATNAAGGNFIKEMQGADYNYAIAAATAHEHGFNASTYLRAMDIRSSKVKRTVSESDALHDHGFGEHIGQFDLEEKIKQLPALSLDAYLQRKRNTKKKKKFTARKRTSNSVSLPITDHHQQKQQQKQQQQYRPRVMTASAAVALTKSEINKYVQQQHQHQQQAVGSQKRKARKESITRRDVSAIESEVASLMPPLATNYELSKCNFYNAATEAVDKNSQSTCDDNGNGNSNMPATCTSNVNAANSSGNLSRAFSSYGDDSITTTTSDLFILAEVAAKRTELTNSLN